jgi:hypothetical protein
VALQIAWRRKQSGSKKGKKRKWQNALFAFYLYLPFLLPFDRLTISRAFCEPMSSLFGGVANSISPAERSRKIDWRDLLIYLVVSSQRLFALFSDLMFCHSAPGIHYRIFQPDFQ